MSRKKQRVSFELDTGEIKNLADEEIKAILRAADELIATGGRSMLAKILKGSKDKNLLEHGLNDCPFYGFYKEQKLEKIINRIDWLIQRDYLAIEYSGGLPMIVFTEKGWIIERETYAEELASVLESLLGGRDYRYVQKLKDRNRGMILLLLEKIEHTENARYIPLLSAWKTIECKKMQAEIQKVIDRLKEIGRIL